MASIVPGRLRVRIDSLPGQGKLHRLADELNGMSDTRTVRANHAARSVTVTYDPKQTSATTILERLHHLGSVVIDLSEPGEWPGLLLSEVVPLAEDPSTLAGKMNADLLHSTFGALDVFRLTVDLLIFSVVMQVRGALRRGDAIPWLKVVTYLLAAASMWTKHQKPASPTAVTEAR